ncbi:MBOAT family protein [Anaerofustis stercorihominis]|uniref:MBOAT family O-acyltransferase n=3 Tax=Anaerofustis stercorihominis TaxID=214853 RepID=UPI00210AA3F6|nr:MBOAT family O-acyltransferase [Anaerofustis stercorihominis]MCQ4796031.1 MBOAT family protein [Anaerofustis stercorihominis]
MLFSSNIFIFIFLPIVLFVYYFLLGKSRNLQNIFLFIASLFFYAWGEPKFVLIMLLSIIYNWLMGLLVNKYRDNNKISKLIIFVDVLGNLFIIFIFKYLMFTINNINSIFDLSLNVPNIALPIGISFFTFQAISYVIDVYRGKGEAQSNLINVGLYISLFPQLIAGPIVRYETVSYEIKNRKENIDDFTDGVVRFIVGLGKKVIISNNMALVADKAFNLINSSSSPIEEISILMSWLGAISYTLQIYFDFGGYSDMAIGLGKMFGFHFLENFNYPYISKSATEFWRRWHISLSSWFRDYVYIPLGGSRVNKYRHILNLFIVWLLTGIWHGANWTFIIWGLMYFILLIIEKFTSFDIDCKNKKHNWIKHIYTMFFVIIGWVIFRSENVYVALNYIKSMFGIGNIILFNDVFLSYIRQFFIYFVVGIIASSPILKIAKRKLKNNIITNIIYILFILIIFIICISFIVKGSYNPFIYFNF